MSIEIFEFEKSTQSFPILSQNIVCISEIPESISSASDLEFKKLRLKILDFEFIIFNASSLNELLKNTFFKSIFELIMFNP